MKKLLTEWKKLDERFIPDTEKQLYKETFQRYKEKMAGCLESKGVMDNQDSPIIDGKTGRKKGRRTLTESIQAVGETLVNSGRVIPLSEVFLQTPRKF